MSNDAEGAGRSVERQEWECRRLVRELGYPDPVVYVDNDASAFRQTPRPSYERLLADVAGGVVHLLVAWHPDRLYRRHQDLVRFVDTVEAAGTEVRTVVAGHVDLCSPSGRLIARIVGAVAQHESERMGERLRSKHRELAEAGRWGGGCRPFGYSPGRDGSLSLHTDEARVIREAAARVLAGESLYAIARDLQNREVPTVRGGRWSQATLRGILTRPSVHGLRTSGGEVIGRARWEPILDDATYEDLRLILLNPVGRQPRPSRVALLSASVLRCGVCGGPLHVDRSRQGNRVYNCVEKTPARSCRSVSVAVVHADRTVTAAVLDRLSTRGVTVQRPAPDPEDVRALLRTEALLRRSARELAQGAQDEMQWREGRRSLIAAREVLDSRISRASRAQVLQALPYDRTELERQWNRSSLPQRQTIVDALVAAAVVRPAPRRGAFEPERILSGLRWHGLDC